MIWSILKIALFILSIGLLALGASWVIETGSDLQITFGQWELTLTPLATVFAGFAALLGLWLVLKLIGLAIAVWRFLNGDETAISRYFDRSRERKGFQALADGMMALASGEPRVALARAAKAEKYLQRPELTRLLTAQAAEAAGDRKKALEAYKALVADDRTRFVGIQGIMKQKLAEGDTEAALKLAEKAFALRPRHQAIQDTLFRLQSEAADWKGARRTLAAKLKAHHLPRDVHTRRDAVLALAEAREKAAEGDISAANHAAAEANRLSPELIPAAVMAAEAQIRAGSRRNAAKIIRKAWTAQPHPELAAAYAAIDPEETPAARLRRFAPLLKIHPDHPETRLLKAELALTAGDTAAARAALGELPETAPTARALALMAAIAKADGDGDPVVRGWLAKAVSAPRGPQWVCDNCNHIHSSWEPICENCGAFDTLSWKDVPESAAGVAPPDLLPLIAGLLDAPDGPDAAQGDDPDGQPATTDLDMQDAADGQAGQAGPAARGDVPKADRKPDAQPEAPARGADDIPEGIIEDAPVIPELADDQPNR